MKNEVHISRLDKKIVENVVAAAKASIDRSTDALLAGDSGRIGKEFSTTFSAAGGDWQFAGHDDIVKRVGSGKVKYDYIRTEVEQIAVPAENIAVVSGKRSVKAVVDGNDFASTFPFKAVHVLEGDAWRVALWAVNC